MFSRKCFMLILPIVTEVTSELSPDHCM